VAEKKKLVEQVKQLEKDKESIKADLRSQIDKYDSNYIRF